jgi:hypothetical protein
VSTSVTPTGRLSDSKSGSAAASSAIAVPPINSTMNSAAASARNGAHTGICGSGGGGSGSSVGVDGASGASQPRYSLFSSVKFRPRV